jgi:hypothetical protein
MEGMCLSGVYMQPSGTAMRADSRRDVGNTFQEKRAPSRASASTNCMALGKKEQRTWKEEADQSPNGVECGDGKVLVHSATVALRGRPLMWRVELDTVCRTNKCCGG